MMRVAQGLWRMTLTSAALWKVLSCETSQQVLGCFLLLL